MTRLSAICNLAGSLVWILPDAGAATEACFTSATTVFWFDPYSLIVTCIVLGEITNANQYAIADWQGRKPASTQRLHEVYYS